MVKAKSILKMVAFSKDTGKIIYPMEKEYIFMQVT